MDYWDSLVNELVNKYKQIMIEKNFQYWDVLLCYFRNYHFKSPEEQRKYKESYDLHNLIKKEIDKMPKEYRALVQSKLEKDCMLKNGGLRYGSYYRTNKYQNI